MATVATIIFAVVVVAVIYATMRKPKPDTPDPAAADSLLPPNSPQRGGGPLNPEK